MAVRCRKYGIYHKIFGKANENEQAYRIHQCVYQSSINMGIDKVSKAVCNKHIAAKCASNEQSMTQEQEPRAIDVKSSKFHNSL